MTRLNPLHAGAALGSFAVVVHAVWAALVAAGVAQPLIDFIFRLHFIRPPYQIGSFDLGTAGLLLLIAGGGAFLAGAVLAVLWNAIVARRD